MGSLNGKKTAIKVFDKQVDRSFNEAFWIKELNKKDIGPKLVSYDVGKVMYLFVKGKPIEEFIKQDKRNPTKIIISCLKQCRIMDKLKVDKEELNHPQKHILVNKKRKITMIDFEKCHSTERPKNVTQFCQYITSFKLKILLSKKGLKIKRKDLIPLLKEYKNNQTDANFRKILRYIRSCKKKK